MAYYGRTSFWDKLGAIGTVAFVGLWAAVIIGWFMNIFDLVGIARSAESLSAIALNLELILRVVGLFIAPLGSIMGIFF